MEQLINAHLENDPEDNKVFYTEYRQLLENARQSNLLEPDNWLNVCTQITQLIDQYTYHGIWQGLSSQKQHTPNLQIAMIKGILVYREALYSYFRDQTTILKSKWAEVDNILPGILGQSEESPHLSSGEILKHPLIRFAIVESCEMTPYWNRKYPLDEDDRTQYIASPSELALDYLVNKIGHGDKKHRHDYEYVLRPDRPRIGLEAPSYDDGVITHCPADAYSISLITHEIALQYYVWRPLLAEILYQKLESWE